MLFALIALGWWWFDTLKSRETAIIAARAACEAEGVLLLDWTVSNALTRFTRNEHGRVQIKRAYDFEYTTSGDNRVRGSVVVIGREVVMLNLAQ